MMARLVVSWIIAMAAELTYPASCRWRWMKTRIAFFRSDALFCSDSRVSLSVLIFVNRDIFLSQCWCVENVKKLEIVSKNHQSRAGKLRSLMSEVLRMSSTCVSIFSDRLSCPGLLLLVAIVYRSLQLRLSAHVNILGNPPPPAPGIDPDWFLAGLSVSDKTQARSAVMLPCALSIQNYTYTEIRIINRLRTRTCGTLDW